MNFPWLCSSSLHNFSEIIRSCFESPIKYLNYEDEQKIFLDALRVVLEAELRLEKLYPKEKPIFRRPINPLALKPLLIEKNMKVILEEKKNEQFFDEKTFVYEKPKGLEVGVVKVKKGAFNKKRMFSPQANENTITDETHLLGKRMNSFKSSRSFKSNSNSARSKRSDNSQNELKFYITEEFLNLSTINSWENSEFRLNPQKKIQFVADLKQKMELECSKILNKSKVEKEKLKKIDETQKFDKKNQQNVLPRLTEKLGVHTTKEINLLEHQQKDLVKEFNQYYHTK